MVTIPAAFVILQDSREQAPLSFGDIPVEVIALPTGDYTCRIGEENMLDIVAIERKSPSDLLGCIGNGRDRFTRELQRLSDIRFKAIIIEGAISDLLADPHSTLKPAQIMGSVLAWYLRYGVAPIFCGNRKTAAATVKTLLLTACRYHNDPAVTAAPTLFDRMLASQLRPLRLALCEVGDMAGLNNQPLAETPDAHVALAQEHLAAVATNPGGDNLVQAAAQLLMALEVAGGRAGE